MGGGLRKSDVGSQMSDKRRLTVNSRRLTVNGKRLTVLVISLILLISFVTVAIATGFFGTNTTKISSLEKGLVAHYPLDGVHQTKDTTPYGNHGTNNGATLTTGVKGEANGAYEFDTDSIIIPHKEYINFNSGKEITYSFLLNTYVLGSTKSIFTKRTNTTDGILVFLSSADNSLRVQCKTTNTVFQTGFIPTVYTWYKIDLVFNETESKLYVNGNLYSTGIPIETFTNTADLYVGNNYLDGTNYYFNGKIADFRIYNRALSDSEIKLLYDSYKPKASASDLNKGLVGHWMLDAENGAKDLTPYGNHGTGQGGITMGGVEDRKGKSGGATNFDGVDDYISGLKYREVNTGSISTWTYLTKSNFNSVFSSSIPNRLYLFLDTAIQIGLGDNSNINVGLSNSIIMNKWAYLTFTWDSSSWKFYYDGTLINSGSYTGTPIIATTSRIGGTPTGIAFTDRPFGGKIYDLRIYNRVLSEDEIKLLYDQYKPKEASIGSLQKGLVLDMPLTTKHMKSATVVSDLTPYGNDGTVNGATVGSEYTSFDGVDDNYINLGVDSSLDLPIVSISIWFKTSNRNEMKIFKTSDTFTNKYGIVMNNPGYMTIITSDADYINFQTNSLYNDNIWHHFVGITNPSLSENKVYIDGELAEGGQITETLVGIGDYTRISGRPPSSYNFDGSISNLKIYNRALSAEEVKLLYEKSKGSE